MTSTANAVYFRYTNYRGELSVRHASPISLRLGRSQWHSKTQWLLRAFDHDKQEEREFALSDCNFAMTPTTDKEG